MKWISILMLIGFSSFVCHSQSNQLKADSYSKSKPTKTFTIKSDYAKNREYIMHVTYAMDSLIPGKKYPVLYYTDAWLNVDFFNQAGDWLSYYKEIEPVILIGISFTANENDWIELRKEDFLPHKTDSTKVSGPKHFLNFMSKELIPYVQEHYPADPSDRGLFGYSLGGLFASWVLKEDPKLFKRVGISSPSLWYDDFQLLKDPKLVEGIAKLNDQKIFVEYGSSESEDQKSGAESLFELLNTNKHIQLKKFVLEGGHYSAYPQTIIKTLTYLYAR